MAVAQAGVGWKGRKTLGPRITGSTRLLALGRDAVPGTAHGQAEPGAEQTLREGFLASIYILV